MSPERWQQIESVFQTAADLPTADRRAYLDQACASDDDLRSEVESLLDSEGLSHIAPAIEEAAKHVSTLEGQRLGVYELLAPIGEGGMGTVYKAKRVDGQFEQEVAIKIIRAGASNPLNARRFLEERNLLAQLQQQHPSIARLIDGGDHAGIPYNVVELIAGGPSDAYCRQWHLTVTERLEIFMKGCDAVQHAHAALIVHRDLKPSNILVTADGTPKLLDFGIAKLVVDGQASTQTGWMMTPDYASPEQVRGEAITVASDVYSLGIVLYELLTGERPYKLKNYSPAEIQNLVCTTEIHPPSHFVPTETRLRKQLVGDLDNILLMALRKEAGRRYGSVAQFAEDIRRHLAGETVIARPDTFTYRWSKFARRNRLPLTLATLLVAAVTIGAALT
ncbi:MAG: serine/threonine-protein kinase, partial [Acidobacteria bacterium]|nr:serine/threonine-protein kinase [Acidobacteriota bacterium]